MCRNSAIGTKRSDHSKEVAALDGDHYIDRFQRTSIEVNVSRGPCYTKQLNNVHLAVIYSCRSVLQVVLRQGYMKGLCTQAKVRSPQVLGVSVPVAEN